MYDNGKENPTQNLNGGITLMSPVVANMILATMAHNNNLHSDMDSITGSEAFEKANKIATYQRVIHTVNSEIQQKVFTNAKSQPVENEVIQKITEEAITEALKRVTKKFRWKYYKILHTMIGNGIVILQD